MISVRCEYANYPSKSGNDYFVYTNFEVSGHADTRHESCTTAKNVCAGVSACCFGIRRLVDEGQFNIEIRKGYFRVWTDRTKNLKRCLNRDTTNALNTLLCQLYELYCEYPMFFKSFDLVDVKENIEDEQKRNNDEQWCGREPKRNLQKMDIYPVIKDISD